MRSRAAGGEMQELYKKSSLALLRAKKRMKTDDDPSFLDGARRILDFMYRAWQDQKCCDLVIKVNGGDIHAHSVAFGAYSDTLTNSFYGYTNGEIINLDLTDFRREVVLTIIHFLYTTELELNCHIIGQALSCSTKLGMDVVVSMCMDYLSKITPENAVLHYSIAENNQLKELRDDILRFILENFSDVSKSKHFVYLPYNRLLGILNKEDLSVNDEVDVFRAVVRWVDHERGSRIQHSRDLLQCVRFPLMSAEVLSNEVETSDWIFVNQDQWRDCLYKAMKYNALNATTSEVQFPSSGDVKYKDTRRSYGGDKMAGDSPDSGMMRGREQMRDHSKSRSLAAKSSQNLQKSSPQLQNDFLNQQHRQAQQLGQARSLDLERPSEDLVQCPSEQLQPRPSQHHQLMMQQQKVSSQTNQQTNQHPQPRVSQSPLEIQSPRNPSSISTQLSQSRTDDQRVKQLPPPSPQHTVARPSSRQSSMSQMAKCNPLERQPSTGSYQMIHSRKTSADGTIHNSSRNAATGSMQSVNSRESFYGSELRSDTSFDERTDKVLIGSAELDGTPGRGRNGDDSLDVNASYHNFLESDAMSSQHYSMAQCTMDSSDTVAPRYSRSCSYQSALGYGDTDTVQTRGQANYASRSSIGLVASILMGVGGINLHSDSLDCPGRVCCCYETANGGRDGKWKEMKMSVPFSVHHHGIATVGSRLFVIGGAVYKGGEHLGLPVSSVYMYDSLTGRWQSVASLPEPRAYLAAASWRNQIFAAGGENANKVKLSSVLRYDTDENCWSVLTQIPGGARVGAAVAVHQDGLFVVGGYNKDLDRSGVLADVCFYDLLYDSWIQLNSLTVPRCHASLVVVADRLLLVGGRTRAKERQVSSLSTILEYNLEEDTWSDVTRMPFGRHDMGCAAIGSRLYIAGGIQSPNPDCLTTVDCYDVMMGQWLSQMAPYPYPTAGLGLAVVRAPYQTPGGARTPRM